MFSPKEIPYSGGCDVAGFAPRPEQASASATSPAAANTLATDPLESGLCTCILRPFSGWNPGRDDTSAVPGRCTGLR